MVTLGVSFEGYTHVPLKRTEQGHLVPDASVDALHDRHREYLRDQVEAARVAEDLGFDYVVHSEHHGSVTGPVSPNPALTQTAIARETSDLRLLQMANILPWHHPVRLAEQLGMVDVLSDGRVEVGVGRGMFDPAGTTLGQHWGGSRSGSSGLKQYQSFDEALEMLLAAWTEDFLDHRGEFHSVPPSYTDGSENAYEYLYFDDEACEYDPETQFEVSEHAVRQVSLPVQPQPAQEPHPQLWKPAGSPGSAAWAAERGMNVCVHMSDVETVRAIADAYHEAAADAGWPDRRPALDGTPFERGWDAERTRGLAVIVPVMNTAIASEETLERWKRSYEYALAQEADLDLAASGTAEPGVPSIDMEERLASRDLPIHGDATAIARRLTEIATGCEFEDAFFVLGSKTVGLTHEEHLEQLTAFADRVAPGLEDALD